jgi:tetratricopeptide (TPR) repeat protein
MNYSREDLAKDLLEQIFNNSKIKLTESQKYLEKAYLFLILCYFNENEDLLSIPIMIDLLNIISDENNEKDKYKFLYEEKYLSKEFIEKINQRNFDITIKEEYNNYINNKQKIHDEIENYIKHKIVTNNNENYNQLLLLLYGLILISNEKYDDAQNIFNQLTILDETNYFYYNTLGVVCVNQKNLESAIKFYKKALKINSNYPKCLINLSVLLLNKGQYKESCKFLISALKIYDDIPDAWNYLLSNVIELNEEDLIFDINNKNLENVEKALFDKK